ncbi:MAG TPA: ABC transporter permease subunit [Bacillota bacterium]|jgi:iron(III) transport system permease protein|nr:ABC transporter permease subunit [Fastidiosipila sp.]HPX92895.1 ABC transporter permease subunit [Bacillota bacterium]HQB80715.1 ABC transporter permease subunit [Bacillota bacterium]
MKGSKGLTGVKYLLLAFFAFSVFLPLIRMLAHMAGIDIRALLASGQFLNALKNSLVVTTVSTLISVALAAALAWLVERSGIRFKGFFTLLFTLPMLIPSISHGMGLVVLFGANGILTNWLGLKGSVYGFWGIVTGSVIYSFPVAFLMLSDILRYEDSTPYEAAEVLGIPRGWQFTSITVPYLRRPLTSTVFAIFTLIIIDYGVPLMIGGQYRTLPVMMYQDVIGLLDFGKGSAIGLVLLTPAVIAFLLDVLNRDRGIQSFVSKPFRITRNRVRDGLAYLLSALVSLGVALPIGAFLLLTLVRKYPADMRLSLDNVRRTFQMSAGANLGHSLLIALFTSLTGLVLTFAAAYLTARSRGRLSKLLHLASLTSLAIPGIVLGLSYVLFFKGSLIYGTLAILILVNLVHFFASPYLMIYNTLSKINQHLEAAGQTLGVSRFSVIRDVIIPQTAGTLGEMFTYFFVNSMMTISAVAFLATAGTRPLSLMITSFEAQMMLECAAFIALLILTVNLVVRGLFAWNKKRIGRGMA